MNATIPRFIIAGPLRRDYAVLPSGRALLDVPGGSLLYAAAGLLVWEKSPAPGLVARVGEDYPQEWLDTFKSRGMDTRGIRVLPEAIDLRSFYIYSERNARQSDDPVAHFSRLGMPFPKSLLGYRSPSSSVDSRTKLTQISLRQADIIPDYLDASAAHLCPIEY
ncbi:MAG: hypothetical protein EHM70_04620, partial [Chloroflexota bacterium]